MKVRVPGKLILSGEHAVLYGAPALAMAVNRYVTATATPQTLPLISFDLSDLAYQNGLTLTALKRLKSRIYQQYQRFVKGETRIRDVLRQSHELAQFAITLLIESFNCRLAGGIKIRVQSDIPVGCGMGSSAATILAVVHAMMHFLQKDISTDALYRLALEAENMQHGKSSGLDIKICLQGGMLFSENGSISSRAISTLPFYLVNTGMPATTTGECVSVAQSYFRSKSFIDEFATVTRSLDFALNHNDFDATQLAIRENQKLLNQIGVVPEKIQKFIQQLEKQNHAAKICGAGAVRGDRAGVILVATQDIEMLAESVLQYGFSLLPVTGESRGVHVI